MPELVLTTLKFVFLGLLYLFVARAIRVIWLDIAGPSAAKPRAGVAARAPRPAQRSASRGAAPRAIVVLEENLPPRTYPLRDGEVTIGRAAECTVVLNDTYVSQLHTKIYVENGFWQVADLGSTNGTFLNRVRLADPAPVAAGDEVRLGKTLVEVRAK